MLTFIALFATATNEVAELLLPFEFVLEGCVCFSFGHFVWLFLLSKFALWIFGFGSIGIDFFTGSGAENPQSLLIMTISIRAMSLRPGADLYLGNGRVTPVI